MRTGPNLCHPIMVELKVHVDGVQRVVCGVSEATRCHDVILALAQATGQVGRFNLVEKCQASERSLRPNENPLRVMATWGPNAKNAYFLLRKTGTTPGNSRPPSVTREIGERLKQVNSPTESLGEFPQERHTSVRRSQTFSGYRGSTTHPGQGSQKITATENARQKELSEIVCQQQERLAHQYRDLVDIESIIQTLVGFEPLPDAQLEDSDSGIEEFELRSKRNKAELRELEYWESELEIESQMHSALTEKIDRLRGRVLACEEELLLRQREIADLERAVAERRERLRRREDEAAQSRLAELQEDISLLEQEYKEYIKNTKETEAELARLDQSLDDKRSRETRLVQDLATENLTGFYEMPSSADGDGSAVSPSGVQTTLSMERLQRQRAESMPAEMYATFPFRRLVSARHFTAAEPSGDNPEGVFV